MNLIYKISITLNFFFVNKNLRIIPIYFKRKTGADFHSCLGSIDFLIESVGVGSAFQIHVGTVHQRIGAGLQTAVFQFHFLGDHEIHHAVFNLLPHGLILFFRDQVQLAEINQQITSAQTALDHSKSEYVQMQARAEALLSTSSIEEYARTQLGMTKATNQQKEYISLSQGDKAEVYTESSDNVFTRIGDFFSSLWS